MFRVVLLLNTTNWDGSFREEQEHHGLRWQNPVSSFVITFKNDPLKANNTEPVEIDWAPEHWEELLYKAPQNWRELQIHMMDDDPPKGLCVLQVKFY